MSYDRIIVDYLSTSNPPTVTSNPLFVYWFDSTAFSLLDRTGQGRDLTVESGSASYETEIYSGLVGIDLSGCNLIAPSEEALRIAKDSGGGGDASLTVELVFIKHDTLPIIRCYSSGESLETNVLYGLGQHSGSSYFTQSEYGAGLDTDITFTSDVIFDEMIYLAMTVSSDGQTRRLYLNGSLIDTITTQEAEKATSGNTQRLRFDTTDTVLFSARLTAETFGDSAIYDAYEDLLGEGSIVLQKSDNAAWEDYEEFISSGGEPKYQGFSYPGVGIGVTQEVKKGAWEDRVEKGGGGIRKHYHHSDWAAGEIIPGGIRTKSRQGDRQELKGGIEDRVDFLNSGGNRRYNYPRETSGALFSSTYNNVRKDSAAFEDVGTALISNVTDINRTTNDIHGYAHFLSSYRPIAAYIYDTTNEPWTKPTENNFSGYSIEGYKYTSGVQDAGPVEAPWRTEGASDYRGPDSEFPSKSLIIVANKELIIFDLDSYDGTAANLTMWMRFMFDDDSNFKALGRGEASVRSVKMVNGVLVVGTETVIANGGVITIDFKATGQNVFSLVRSDGHWQAISGKTIANRNDTGGVYTQTGVSPSLRIGPEYVKTVDAIFDETDITQMWVVLVGEDISPGVVMYVDNIGQTSNSVVGDDVGEHNVMTDGYRNLHFDQSGWLWFSRENKIWRNVFDYKYGRLTQNSSSKSIDKMIVFPYNVRGFFSGRDYIFVVTEGGVYMLNRGTMDYWLAYSLTDLGGGGNDNTPPDGEILIGQSLSFRDVMVLSTSVTDYLFIASWLYESYGGNVNIVRMLDDNLVNSYTYPNLDEDGCFWIVGLPY